MTDLLFYKILRPIYARAVPPCLWQRDAEDLRAEVRAVQADMTAAARSAEAERQEGLRKLCHAQSKADAQVCPHLLSST